MVALAAVARPQTSAALNNIDRNIAVSFSGFLPTLTGRQPSIYATIPMNRT